MHKEAEQNSNLIKLIAVEKDARNFGFEWPHVDSVLDQALSETEEIRQAIREQEPASRVQEEVGDLLHTAISLCIFLGYDVDKILNLSSEKFLTRMNALKAATRQRGLTNLKGQSTNFMLQLWDEIKQLEKSA